MGPTKSSESTPSHRSATARPELSSPVALGVCIIGGLGLASSTVHEGLRLKLGSAAISSQNTERDGSHQLVDDLLLQVEALKDEIQELSKAPRLTPLQASRPIRNPATVYRPYTGTQTRPRCRSESRVSRIRGAPCRFHDGQQRRVLHCVRLSRARSPPHWFFTTRRRDNCSPHHGEPRRYSGDTHYVKGR
jgi:hypothetical protein